MLFKNTTRLKKQFHITCAGRESNIAPLALKTHLLTTTLRCKLIFAVAVITFAHIIKYNDIESAATNRYLQKAVTSQVINKIIKIRKSDNEFYDYPE